MIADTTVTSSALVLKSYLVNNNIEGFAIRNYRDRYLIPSSENIFGSMKIEYVLIDSGLNSSLFSLPMTSNDKFDINSLLNNFPFDKYIWSIATAYEVDLLSDMTLYIKPKKSDDGSLNTIKCSLHADIKPLYFELPYIRFSLDKESIMVLAETNQIPFWESDKDALQKRSRFFSEFENHLPSMRDTIPREYCLLGQHFLKNLCTIQVNDAMIFVDKNKTGQRLFPVANTNMNDIAKYLHFERPWFAKTHKFLMCEDDAHGGRDLLYSSGETIEIDEPWD